MTIPHQHLPVMAKEVIKLLEPSSEKVFVDATFGLGGHSEEIKKQNAKCKIIAFDLDAQALKKARKKLAAYQNIEYLNDNFTQIKKYVKEKVDGILFDLGLCSFALDDPKRGFSFQKDGPLDMRFNQKQKLTAAEIVNHYPEKKLTEIFKNYGEEHFAQRISRALCNYRKKEKINRTLQLKQIVEKATPSWRKRETLARIFQALRICVNQELENLKKGLPEAINLLKPKGRIVVISYHSLEDRMVKHTFREFQKNGILKILTKKPLLPTKEEIKENPRAKSAKLRAAEKIGENL